MDLFGYVRSGFEQMYQPPGKHFTFQIVQSGNHCKNNVIEKL